MLRCFEFFVVYVSSPRFPTIFLFEVLERLVDHSFFHFHSERVLRHVGDCISIKHNFVFSHQPLHIIPPIIVIREYCLVPPNFLNRIIITEVEYVVEEWNLSLVYFVFDR